MCGRPGKTADTCYAWWCLASLVLLDVNLKSEGVGDVVALRRFLEGCQNNTSGGFSDRHGKDPDAFHTMLGIAAIALFSPRNGPLAVDTKAVLPEKYMPSKNADAATGRCER